MTKTFIVTVKPPTDFHKGRFKIDVKLQPDGTFYCYSWTFGCSTDYAVETATEAIKLFLAEHACTVVTILEMK